MSKAVQPIPEGYHTVTPYLAVSNAQEALDFYRRAFGAAEVVRMDGPDGKIGHAEVQIGDSRIMLSDEWEEGNHRSPLSYGGTPVSIHLYVPDVDKAVADAVTAGATLRDAVEDKFYGDRMGTLVDPFGHVWFVSTHVEDLTEDEIRQRAEAYMAQMAAG
ncbi:MAG: VOC family protein [Bauldia litoralis]